MMKLGVLGGTGLYEMDGLTNVRARALTTPYGSPSDEYVCGQIAKCEVFFLPRHGRGHRLLPSEINHRANIYGFKMMGVDRVISISAVGSLREELSPRDIVLPDQYFDRTKSGQGHTFFGNGVVGHVSFGDPACSDFRKIILHAIRAELGANPPAKAVRVVEGGTYVNMEGPAFSTRAESNAYRKMGFDVIGMTSLPEAKLCREAEICYQSVAMVTDYDCWHAREADVTIEIIIKHLLANVGLARNVVRRLAARLPAQRHCECRHALQNAILTSPGCMSAARRAGLALLLDKYYPPARK